MSTLCIVPCGRKKIWDKFPNHGPTEAKFVYIGPFASKCKEYAEMFFPSSGTSNDIGKDQMPSE